MRAKIFSNVCYVVAGFFFYTVALLAFIRAPSFGWKVAFMGGFLVPAVLLLAAGLALSGFRRTLRDIGIVLVSSAGFTLFLVGTFACMLATDDFKDLMPLETLNAFTDYFPGFGSIALLLVIGLIVLRAGLNRARMEHGR